MSIKYNDLIPYHVDRARFEKVNMHEGQPFNWQMNYFMEIVLLEYFLFHPKHDVAK